MNAPYRKPWTRSTGTTATLPGTCPKCDRPIHPGDRIANTAAGWPMVSQMRDEGKTQAQIDQVLQDKADEATAQSNSLAEALLNQQRQFDQGNMMTGQRSGANA